MGSGNWQHGSVNTTKLSEISCHRNPTPGGFRAASGKPDASSGTAIWDRGHLAAVIDWDQAEPGVELDDIAQLAWYTVPLRGNEYAETVGGFATTDLRERLQILCQTHGQQPSNVLNAAIDIQTRELSRIETLGQREIEPWLSFFNRGDASEIHRERAWTENQRKALAS
jgi:hypothetical protein